MSLKTIPASVGREVPIGSSGRESGSQWVENWREGVMEAPLRATYMRRRREVTTGNKRGVSVSEVRGGHVVGSF